MQNKPNFDLSQYLQTLSKESANGTINFPSSISAQDFDIGSDDMKDITPRLMHEAIKYIAHFIDLYLSESNTGNDNMKFAFSPELHNLNLKFKYDKSIKFGELISLLPVDEYLPKVIETFEIPSNSIVKLLENQHNILVNTLQICDDMRKQCVIAYMVKNKITDMTDDMLDEQKNKILDSDEIMDTFFDIIVKFVPLVILQWECLIQIIDEELELTNAPIEMIEQAIEAANREE